MPKLRWPAMFEPQPHPRLFTIPLGADIPRAIVDGLIERTGGGTALARCHLIVATGRLKRRLMDAFRQSGITLLPKMTMIDALAAHPALPDAAGSRLERQLQLAQLVRALLEAEDDLAPPSAAYDLAESLLRVLDELAGEAVPFTALDQVAEAQYSAHWQRTLKFLKLLEPFADGAGGQARLRQLADVLGAHWQERPPAGPLLIVGSTGSRGGTAALMEAVARLPNGAVLLPGVDPDLPEALWDLLAGEDEPQYDHPQTGFARLARRLGVSVPDLPHWSGTAPCPARMRLLSLALRPPPVTDDWLKHAPALAPELHKSFRNVSLITAPGPREEAEAIAFALRRAADQGRRSALITPDRDLARRVSTALDRWRITPDDSAGRPLQQTPTGLFLRLVLEAGDSSGDLPALVAALKHPFTWRGVREDGMSQRGAHLRRLRQMEVMLLRGNAARADWVTLQGWAAEQDAPAIVDWMAKLRAALTLFPKGETLADHVSAHMARAEALFAGPHGDAAELWAGEEGQMASALFSELTKASAAAGSLTARDYAALFQSVISARNLSAAAERADSRIKILGTLEARVVTVDLMILGGLNDGIWPPAAPSDPWMNRQMRRDVGLPMPERQIGLSAHDFSQACGAPELILSRAARTGTTPQVASRWMIRLENLVHGMEGGPDVWAAASERGDALLQSAAAYHATPDAPRAPRPAPSPPKDARPRTLSVTRVETLARDPYAIYAEKILRLTPLPPLGEVPQAILRGNLLHDIMEAFVKAYPTGPLPPDAAETLARLIAETLRREVPWPLTRALWAARLDEVMPRWLAEETRRRRLAAPCVTEARGTLALGEATLTAKADRIDRAENGLVIYDYKTSSLPAGGQVGVFDLQVLLEAAMAARGAFPQVPSAPVVHMEYISLLSGKGLKPDRISPKSEPSPEEVLARVGKLMQDYLDGAPYVIRLWPSDKDYDKPFDHLARFGEWGDGDRARTQEVGR